MNNIEKYIDFLDNNLNPMEEQKFAELFAIDSEFRSGFKKYLLLTNSLNESSDYFTPSNELKGALFTSLGLGAAAVVTPDPVKQNVLKNLLNNNLFVALMACLGTFVLTYLFMRPNLAENNTFSAAKFNNYNCVNEKVNSKPQNEIVQNQTIRTKEIKTKSVPSVSSISDNSTNLNKEENDNSYVPEIQNKSDLFEFKSMNSASIKYTKPGFTGSTIKPVSPNNLIINLDEILPTDWIKLMGFEFCNTPSWFSQTANIQPAQTNKFNNLSLAIMVPVCSWLKAGINFRQETFYVHYTGTVNGADMDYYQQPNLTTLGVNARVYPIEISEKIKPFIQLDLGANKAGAALRSKLGLEYAPLENIYVILGGEYNEFFFTHDSQSFTSDKFSLHYGLGVKF